MKQNNSDVIITPFRVYFFKDLNYNEIYIKTTIVIIPITKEEAKV